MIILQDKNLFDGQKVYIFSIGEWDMTEYPVKVIESNIEREIGQDLTEENEPKATAN